MSIAYYNGSFMPIDEVRIPLTDRAVFFGDGIYEALLARGGVAHFLDSHIERFYRNLYLLGIHFDISPARLSSLVNESIKLSGEDIAFVYFQLTKFSEVRIHACPKTDKYNLLITVTRQNLPSKNKRIRLVTHPDLRYKYCNIKTLNLLPAVIASEYAERKGAEEAVLCRGDTVTECAHSNISIIKNGILYTHPNCNLILPGIAREALLNECRRLDIPSREVAFTKEQLYEADAALVTSSTKICMLAESVDGKKFELGSPEALLLCENLHSNFIKSTC